MKRYLYILLIFICKLSVAQDVIAGMPDSDTALRWNAVIEIIVILAGGFAVFGVLLQYRKRRRPEDGGSFGVVFAPAVDYQRYPTTKGHTAKNFFTPAMIVFVVLACLGMIEIYFDIPMFRVVGGIG